MESTRFVAPQGKSQKLREARGIPMPWDALGRPGMLAALHLQDLRVSDCTWEIRKDPTETATQSDTMHQTASKFKSLGHKATKARKCRRT
jgi:hypothetical protein